MTKVSTGYLQVTIFWAQSNKITFILLTAHNIVDTNCWHVQGTAICKAFKFFPVLFPVSRHKNEIGRSRESIHFWVKLDDFSCQNGQSDTLVDVLPSLLRRSWVKWGKKRRANDLGTIYFENPSSVRSSNLIHTLSHLDRPLWSDHFRLDLPRAVATCGINSKDLFKTNSFLKDLKNLNRFLIRELRPELFLKDFSY